MMLEGIGHKEKLKQIALKITKAKVNFKNLINILYKELALAKNF
jgi:hypothetical protein